jgi:hypothetical protein
MTPLFRLLNLGFALASLTILIPSDVLGQAALKSVLVGPVVSGQRKVNARVHSTGEWELKVIEKTKDKSGTEKSDSKFVAKRSVAEQDRGDLVFDLTKELTDLGETGKDGLKVGWILELYEPPAPNKMVSTLTVGANKVEVNLEPPSEGDDVVKGTVFGTVDKVRVYVLNSRGVIVQTGEDAVEAQRFSLGLTRRLVENQTVRVVALTDNAEVGATADFALVEGTGFEFGRVRTYFTLGTTLAAKETTTASPTELGNDGKPLLTRERSYSAADYSVGFAVDYNWHSTLTDSAANSCGVPARSREELIQLERLVDERDGQDFKRFNTKNTPVAVQWGRVLDNLKKLSRALGNITDKMAEDAKREECLDTERARIEILAGVKSEFEQLVVDFAGTIHSAAAYKERMDRVAEAFRYLDRALEDYRGTDPATVRNRTHFLLNSTFEARAGQAPIAAPQTNATTGAIELSATSILQKANTLSLGGTIYAPIFHRGLTWHYKDDENALFIAPLIRASVTGISSGPTVIDTVKTEAGLITQRERNLLDRSLYVARSGGIRVGHYKFAARRKTVAPELLSYLDIAVGRFDNFQRQVVRQRKADSPVELVRFVTPWRLDVESRLKIPQTPLTIGVNANWGQGPDDIRFFFGTRFDFSKLLSRLIPKAE